MKNITEVSLDGNKEGIQKIYFKFYYREFRLIVAGKMNNTNENKINSLDRAYLKF